MKKGGQFIALKSAKGDEELEEAAFGIGVFGGKVIDTISYELPEDAGDRQMMIIEKEVKRQKNIQENLVRQISHHY